MASSRRQRKKPQRRSQQGEGRRPLTPVVFAAALVGVLALLAVAEIRNRLDRPMMDRPVTANGGLSRLVLIHSGSLHRATDLFIENVDGSGTPQFVVPLYPAGVDRSGQRRQGFDDIRWTVDGTGFVATTPGPSRGDQPPLLWLYDMERGVLFGGPEGPQDGYEAQLLETAVAAKGGVGEPFLQAIDMTSREAGLYVPVWRMRRYRTSRSAERPLPSAG